MIAPIRMVKAINQGESDKLPALRILTMPSHDLNLFQTRKITQSLSTSSKMKEQVMSCDKNQNSDLYKSSEDEYISPNLNRFSSSKSKLPIEVLANKKMLRTLIISFTLTIFNISPTLAANNNLKSATEIIPVPASNKVAFNFGFVQCGWILDSNGAIIGYGCVM
jgi:hypothetical protein